MAAAGRDRRRPRLSPSCGFPHFETAAFNRCRAAHPGSAFHLIPTWSLTCICRGGVSEQAYYQAIREVEPGGIEPPTSCLQIEAPVLLLIAN